MAQDIALALIQTVGLLMPVVFLTMTFVRREKRPEMDTETESYFVLLFLLMIGTLTVSGFFLLLGLLVTQSSAILVDIGLLALIGFFLVFGVFLYGIARSVDPQYKQHW